MFYSLCSRLIVYSSCSGFIVLNPQLNVFLCGGSIYHILPCNGVFGNRKETIQKHESGNDSVVRSNDVYAKTST